MYLGIGVALYLTHMNAKNENKDIKGYENLILRLFMVKYKKDLLIINSIIMENINDSINKKYNILIAKE